LTPNSFKRNLGSNFLKTYLDIFIYLGKLKEKLMSKIRLHIRQHSSWIYPTIHSEKLSALPPWKWTFGEWNAMIVRIHMLQKWNAQTFLRKAEFHTKKEGKWTWKPQKIQNFPAYIPHFPA
jgi:hypothetical protein